MTSSENCPFCGAELEPLVDYRFEDKQGVQYRCRSVLWDDGTFSQYEICKDRQIATLTERLEAWRTLDNATESYEPCHREKQQAALNKLRELGEVK